MTASIGCPQLEQRALDTMIQKQLAWRDAVIEELKEAGDGPDLLVELLGERNEPTYTGKAGQSPLLVTSSTCALPLLIQVTSGPLTGAPSRTPYFWFFDLTYDF